MPRKKKEHIPRVLVPAKAPCATSIAEYCQEFTAADLQQYTELKNGRAR
ncbi:MAG TPA: hypothetical protein VG099_24535 [Gemmataceae bacterium]|nr:hypothetical protein [Gemmataceae bacterium]